MHTGKEYEAARGTCTHCGARTKHLEDGKCKDRSWCEWWAIEKKRNTFPAVPTASKE